MKRALVISLMVAALMSVVAFAGPSVNPWFEVNVPDMSAAVPTLDGGVSVEGMLSSAWFVDLGFTYLDGNLLDATNDFNLGFEATIGFDLLATVNETGLLVYGCSFSLTSDATYFAEVYPDGIKLRERTTGFIAEGFVGPLTLWGGIDFFWDGGQWIDYIPTFGMRVDFDIDL